MIENWESLKIKDWWMKLLRECKIEKNWEWELSSNCMTFGGEKEVYIGK